MSDQNEEGDSSGSGSRIRRRRGDARAVPRHLRRAAKTLPGTLRTALMDFVYTCLSLGFSVDAIDRGLVDRAEAALIATGGRSAMARTCAWRRALDALSAEDKTLCGMDLAIAMVNPRGKRTRSEPAGTFPLLEADLAAINAAATAPPKDECDPHRPTTAATATAHGERMLIIAATLRRLGLIGTTVRLVELLDLEMQTAYLQAVSGHTEPSSEYDPGRDDPDVEGAREAPTALSAGDDLSALTYYATRLWGRNCDAAVFARAQRRAVGVKYGMTSASVQQLTELVQPTQLVAIRSMISTLMARAESDTHFRGAKRHCSRMRAANLAAALAIQMDLLLHPSALVGLICESGEPDLIIPTPDGDGRKVPRTEVSEGTREVLLRRDVVRAQMGQASRWLFPRDDLTGPQDERSVCRSLSEVTSALGVAGLTLTVLRDLGALVLIRNNPRNLRRVMVLLGLRSIRSVRQRYAPFLKGVSKHGN